MKRISRVTFIEAGRRGGLATKANKGPDYFVELGKKSAAKRKAKKQEYAK